MDDEAKLPKWARDRFAALRRQVEELERDNAALIGEGDPLRCRNLWFEDHMDQKIAFPAPLGRRRLIFRGSTGRIQIDGVEGVKGGDTWLHILGIDGEGIAVKPEAANVVRIRCSRHGEHR